MGHCCSSSLITISEAVPVKYSVDRITDQITVWIYAPEISSEPLQFLMSKDCDWQNRLISIRNVVNQFDPENENLSSFYHRQNKWSFQVSSDRILTYQIQGP